MNNKVLLVIGIVVLVVGYVVYTNADSYMMSDDAVMKEQELMMSEEDSMMMGDAMVEDNMMKEDSPLVMELDEMVYAYSGQLEDVSGGTASGVAMANYSQAADQGYVMYATFENLPELDADYFYEGWIVRRGENMSVISSGELLEEDGKWFNTYSSNADLTDHDFYVLTLEPNDGDPAPAEHILEGVMSMQ